MRGRRSDSPNSLLVWLVFLVHLVCLAIESRSPKTARAIRSPAYAGSHSCKAVEECAASVLRSLGEGGHASAGSAEDTKGTTAVKPWGSTAMASKHTTIFHGELAQGCGKGGLVRSYRMNVEKTKFYSLHKLCYTTYTSINILTLKGGEVLMATKKAAAKKPVKKAAKKK
jgi:hypothetical protein